MWNGLDNKPYWSYSRDQGDTWSNATMIAPPINCDASNDVGETAGEDEIWNAYLTYTTDAFNETPLLTTVQLNGVDDPLDTEPDCGYNRCGGLGDISNSTEEPGFLSHNPFRTFGCVIEQRLVQMKCHPDRLESP